MTSDPNGEIPIIRDKRRVDPETGELREAPVGEEEVAAGTASQPTHDGGTHVPPSGTAGEGAGGELAAELEAKRSEALELADQLARAKAEVYNTDQRFNAFVKRSRELEAAARESGRQDVVEALIPVLDDIELARQHGELTGPFLAIAEKLEQTLSARFEVERYGAVGEEFDPTMHEALMHRANPEAISATIEMIAQPGYRRAEMVLRPARVGVVGPE